MQANVVGIVRTLMKRRQRHGCRRGVTQAEETSLVSKVAGCRSIQAKSILLESIQGLVTPKQRQESYCLMRTSSRTGLTIAAVNILTVLQEVAKWNAQTTAMS